MGKALSYALSQWESLEGYLKEAEIDNNLVENAIRPTALGKNYAKTIRHHSASSSTCERRRRNYFRSFKTSGFQDFTRTLSGPQRRNAAREQLCIVSLDFCNHTCLANQFQHEQKRIIWQLPRPLFDNCCCGRLFRLRRHTSAK